LRNLGEVWDIATHSQIIPCMTCPVTPSRLHRRLLLPTVSTAGAATLPMAVSDLKGHRLPTAQGMDQRTVRPTEPTDSDTFAPPRRR
jgi:hypothetical protein